MQIEFINYTKDLTCEESVFYFEDSTEALAWYDDYIEQYPDDETGCTYFAAYGVELPACVDVIKEMEALETLNDRGYIISGHGKLDAFENFLDDICFFDGVPERLRWYMDVNAIMRDFECDGLTIIELSDGDEFLFMD